MNSGHDDPFAFVQTIRYRRRSVRMQTDFAMKSTGADDTELLKELLLRIAVGGAA